jgi:hypothetical protein
VVHGSALVQRGETQSLATATITSLSESAEGSSTLVVHFTTPPFASNEVGASTRASCAPAVPHVPCYLLAAAVCLVLLPHSPPASCGGGTANKLLLQLPNVEPPFDLQWSLYRAVLTEVVSVKSCVQCGTGRMRCR